MHTVIHVSGNDRIEFLQGLVTTNMNQEQSHMSCFCNGKGRVIADVYMILLTTKVTMVVKTSMADILINHIKKYKIIADVNWELQECTTTLNPINEHSLSIHYPLGPQLYLTPKDSSTLSIKDDDFHTKHYVIISPRTSEKHLPQSLGYDTFSMIDLKKGCFLGQEVITRLTRLGTLKHKLFHLEHFPCSVGDELLFDDRPVGSIVQQNEDTYAILAKGTTEALHTQHGKVSIIKCLIP